MKKVLILFNFCMVMNTGLVYTKYMASNCKALRNHRFLKPSHNLRIKSMGLIANTDINNNGITKFYSLYNKKIEIKMFQLFSSLFI